MTDRRVYGSEKHAHFVTFSCYKRRKLLSPDQSKRIVLGMLRQRLAWIDGGCIGFVVMPEHVHALVWFNEVDKISLFMNKWKDDSSDGIKKLYQRQYPSYASGIRDDPVWQARYYGFNVFEQRKIEETLDYMHLNPVRAGLVAKAIDWPWSSARWHITRRSVGVPITFPTGFD